jgi:glycosyltransferase involved in cell wall biosynthesis
MSKNIYKVTAIVPAYNEEKKIQGVLRFLVGSANVDEVICINDGSTDSTEKKIKAIKSVKLISYRKNKGKAYAIVKGIKRAIGDIIVFVDADLSGLNNECIKNLIMPLIEGKYDVVIGYPAANNLDVLFRPLSGERSYFKKDLLPYLDKLSIRGYGMELFLNYKFKNRKIKLFPLKGVKHYQKHEKQPYDTVAKMAIVEGKDILSELISQDNPIKYFLRAYFYPFYLKPPIKLKKQVRRLLDIIDKLRNNIVINNSYEEK